MKKKIITVCLFICIFLVVYLFLAHYFIYKRIGDVSLKPSDIKGEYLINSKTVSEKKIVYTALGDSLTAGVGILKYEDSFPYQLAQNISDSNTANVVLLDRAYPGAKTSDLIKNLLTTTINDNPDVITLLVGVNDIHNNVSKNEFAKNYAEILKQLKEGTKAKIFVINLPYLGADSLLLPPYNFYFNYQTKEYNKIIKKLAQENNVEYVDLYTSTQSMFKDPVLYSPDLFHPSAKGYKLWSEIIYANFHN